MATLHAKNREKLPRGIMGRPRNPRSVEHMSPGKAGRAVQFKPLLTPLSLIMICIQERMAVFFSLGKRAVRTKSKSLDITRFSYQQGSIVIVIIIHSKYFTALIGSNPSAFRLGG